MDHERELAIRKRRLAAVAAAIRHVADTFRATPASFLYESDLQSLLYARLFEDLSREPILWRPNQNVWDDIAGDKPLVINPVRSEYPSGVLFDVAVLPPKLDDEQNAWCQPVEIAIEIKFRQADGSGSPFKEDLDKLARYRASNAGRPFTGVFVVFCHRASDWMLAEWNAAPPAGLPIRLNPDELVLAPGQIVAWSFAPPPLR